MKKISFFIFCASLLVLKLAGQTGFQKGYVLKNNGDTLHGEIEYRNDNFMGYKSSFRYENDSLIILDPNQILEFRTDNKYFVSKSYKEKKLFLEFLLNGIIDVYYLKDSIGEHYFIEKEGIGLAELPYEEGIKYKKNNFNEEVKVLSQSKIHKGILAFYMQDAPEFRSKINEIEKPERQNLIKLAKDYNNKVCPGSACEIYEKKMPFLKVNVEPAVGISYLSDIDTIDAGYYFQTGALAHFWLPGTNENLYLTVGLLIYSVKYTTQNYRVIDGNIPVHVEYLFPEAPLRPFFSLGITSPSYSAGLLIRFNKTIYCSIRSLTYFEPSVGWIVPGKFKSCSLLAGIFFKL